LGVDFRGEAAGTLIWLPPPNAPDGSAIELLDTDGTPIPATLTPAHAEPSARRFRLSGTKHRPAFARIRYAEGGTSAPAIVVLADVVRHSVKEARTKKAEGAAVELAEETQRGFWLLEALDVLEAAEERSGDDDAKTIAHKRRSGEKHEPAPEQHRTLDYARFIAGRHLRSDEGAWLPAALLGASFRWCAVS
jgi:hypothetical protein